MKIALAQIELRAGHPQINAQKIIRSIYEAKRNGAAMIIFPDNAIFGAPTDGLSDVMIADIDACRQQIKAAASGIEVVFDGEARKDFTIDNRAQYFSLVEDNDSSAAPIEEKKSFLGRFMSGKKPRIKVSPIGIVNVGKFIYLYGGSAIYNSKGTAVLRVAPFVEQRVYVDSEEIEKFPPDIEQPSEAEKIYRALKYGVKRYLELIGMDKIVIGISGGIDSAVAAALYCDVLGAANVYLVNMPSRFNSSTTRGLSEQLAKNLGCQYMVVPIQETIEATVKQLESTPVTLMSDGSTSTLTMTSFVQENMQARDRSARVLAAVAASLKCGFTCNANKAESTIGYATLYGDCAGILAATADLWKYQVYALAEYFNVEVYGREVIPQGIIDIVPSAELSNDQNVDEGKGDPVHYDYHDHLFKAFVEGGWQPEDILKAYADGRLSMEIGCDRALINKYFPTCEDFVNDLERWWNQYKGIAAAKRLQAPPSIIVSGKPFGANEIMNGAYYTAGYSALKKILLAPVVY